jgi:hypothetical protein
VRFWSKVDKNGPLPDQSNPHYAGLDRCWVWTASKFIHGYGQFKLKRKNLKAHRVAWRIANRKPIPEGTGWHGTCVLHRCDRRECCNPRHLYLGTPATNADDMVRKERQSKGDAHHSRMHPEGLARGDKSGSRLHPERVARGERQWKAKLTRDKVILARKLYAAGGVSHELLGAMFGVTKSVMGKTIRRQLWAHVP